MNVDYADFIRLTDLNMSIELCCYLGKEIAETQIFYDYCRDGNHMYASLFYSIPAQRRHVFIS